VLKKINASTALILKYNTQLSTWPKTTNKHVELVPTARCNMYQMCDYKYSRCF